MSRMTAAMLALAYIATVYLLVVHLFVLWKWQTSPEIDELFIETEYNEIHVAPETSDSIQDLPNQTVVEALKKEAVLAVAQSQEQSESQTASNKLAACHAKIMEWDSDKRLQAALESSVLLPAGSKSIQTLRITSLLLRMSLSEIRDELNLKSAMNVALKEFEGLSQQKMQVRWDIIHNLLFPAADAEHYPAKEKLTDKDLYEMVCAAKEDEKEGDPTKAESSALAENQDVALYVKDSDLEENFMELKRLLQQREENISTYLRKLKESTFVPKTIEEWADGLKEDIADSITMIHSDIEELLAVNRVASEDGEETTGQGHCVAEEDVSALVEEGLNALHRQEDLRSALLRKMKELDPESARKLILDAVLDARAPLPEAKPSKAVNLRRLLETPALLRCVMAGIDLFADFVRNYTRKLDAYVDSLALKVGVTGASSGEIVLTRILQFTGTIQVPVPAKAQELLMRTKRGSDLLTT